MAQQKMLGFTRTEQAMPHKREAALRRQDFAEIYDRFSDAAAAEQAGRCSQCGVPFCQVHCPVANNIPDWLKLAAEGRLEEAYEVSQATNNFPEICGRICPQDRLCEGQCTIEQSTHGSVTIGAVERYLTETAWEKGWVQPAIPRSQRPQSVGIIGAGPAGLAAADQLRKKGYQVHVYDRYDRAGGLLIYGIPSFKLEKEVVARRWRLLEKAGVIFHLGVEIGRNLSMVELRARHDAVLIACGVYKARGLDGARFGQEPEGVQEALAYLTASNRKGLGDTVVAFETGRLNAKDKRVVVIGGGDTAMDCVRTALRQGARSVHCLYRRDRKNMPGSQREVGHAEDEGAQFIWQAAPDGFLGDGRLTGVKAHRMHLGIADASGRQAPTPIDGSDFILEADMAIKALGFDPEDVPVLFGLPELKLNRWGAIVVRQSDMMTSIEGVFAAGDIVRGASLVVWGIKDGRDAAQGIHAYIQAKVQTGASDIAAE
jgi:glutamate synthase (NADPH) small chain